MKSKNEISATVSYINLGGIGFTVDSESLQNTEVTLEKRKVYTLKLKAASEQRNIEFDVKIMIIKMSADSNGNLSCGAVYRKLTDLQIAGLKEISENFTEEFAGSDKYVKLFFQICLNNQ